MIFATIISMTSCWMAVSSLSAEQYPAGVDPRLCPNYPQCDNAILAAFNKYPLPPLRGQSRGKSDVLPEFDHFFFTQPGYPVGLTRDQCPNYPFCH
ncbi:hypothetical protein O3M35_010660 [Rhynocoris fuscipes]|uniref:Cuticle protein CPCFC domain-containing protein n=1 Tax=Rhynocoris fuscipes TaxID=488301 RepID=A0AAW1D6U6_9HEMI